MAATFPQHPRCGNVAAKALWDPWNVMAGPWDVDFAKETRPNTIRAKFGVSNVKNAIHCTDLADIAESELRYFFDLLKPC